MSLLYIDSFDHYNDNTECDRKWDYRDSDISFSTGRLGTGQSVYFNGGVRKLGKDVPDIQTIVVGFGWLHNSSSYATQFLNLMESGTTQLALQTDGSGHIQILRGGTTLETSTQTYTQGVWYYVELKATIDNSSGSYELRVGGETWFSDSGIDTQNTANAYTDQVRIGCSSSFNAPYFDDLYILDTTGSANNDFLGDVVVECIRPTGAGNQTDFTPSTGSNWQNVDDTTPDDDSTYNYHAPQGLPGTDLFTMGDLATISGAVFGIQPVMYVRKDDAGSADIYSVIRTGGTDYAGSGISLPDTYIFHRDLLEENPDTATAWTVADIDGIEGGYRRTS